MANSQGGDSAMAFAEVAMIGGLPEHKPTAAHAPSQLGRLVLVHVLCSIPITHDCNCISHDKALCNSVRHGCKQQHILHHDACVALMRTGWRWYFPAR